MTSSNPSSEQTDFTPDADSDSLQEQGSALPAGTSQTTSTQQEDSAPAQASDLVDVENLAPVEKRIGAEDQEGVDDVRGAEDAAAHEVVDDGISAETSPLAGDFFETPESAVASTNGDEVQYEDAPIFEIPQEIAVLEIAPVEPAELPEAAVNEDPDVYEFPQAFELSESAELAAIRSLPEVEVPTQEEISTVEAQTSAHNQVAQVATFVQEPENMPLVDELGIIDLTDPIAGGRGRLFAAAGRESPIVEFTDEGLVLYPPQKPFVDPRVETPGASEVITEHSDESGILIDEIGNLKKIPGAKYNGHQIYWLMSQKPGTLKHLVGWFDTDGKCHLLYQDGEVVITDEAYKLRNKTHDGELSIFSDLSTD